MALRVLNESTRAAMSFGVERVDSKVFNSAANGTGRRSGRGPCNVGLSGGLQSECCLSRRLDLFGE